MPTFVDTSVLLSGADAGDHDPVVVVVRSAHGMLREGLGETDSELFEKKFATAYGEQDWNLVFDLMLGNAHVIFRKLGAAAPEDKDLIARISKTAEGYFEVVLSLLVNLETMDAIRDRVNAFTKVMLEGSESAAVDVLKFRLMGTLLTFFSERTNFRLEVVKALCAFAESRPKQAGLVLALVREVASWMDLMNEEVSDETRFEIFGNLAKISEFSSDKIKFLSLQAELPVEAPATLVLLAAELVRDLNTANMAPVSGKKISDPALAKCVEILSRGAVDDMSAFLASPDAQKMVAAHSLVPEDIMDKTRVIALSHMAEMHIPIAQIAKSLKTEDPLGVAVKALRAGVIRGAINEVDGVVDVLAARGAKTDLQQLIRHI